MEIFILYNYTLKYLINTNVETNFTRHEQSFIFIKYNNWLVIITDFRNAAFNQDNGNQNDSVRYRKILLFIFRT